MGPQVELIQRGKIEAIADRRSAPKAKYERLKA